MNTSKSSYEYIGSELDLFAEASVWKSYWKKAIRKYLGNSILEVGTGLGASLEIFSDETFSSWLGIEPDPQFFDLLIEKKQDGVFPTWSEFKIGTIYELGMDEEFDTILYIDVLEHIEADREEIEVAVKHLKVGGYLVVIAPSYPFLYSEFDRAIGHVRRYDDASLRKLTPTNVKVVDSKYYDSVGLIASLGNRLFLRSPMPSRGQLWIWDKIFVRLSRILDPITWYSFGKSILFVWRREL